MPMSLLLEPEQRDTAPAICAAALWAKQHHTAGCLLAIMPADHHIEPQAQFETTLYHARQAAQGNRIVTIAIPPTRPATEYGYLELRDGAGHHQPVSHFMEKPDVSTAIQYLGKGNMFWNAGLFVAETGTLLGSFQTHEPDMLEACTRAIGTAERNVTRLKGEAFASARKTSFDYAIMERHQTVAAVHATFHWQDLGTWDAVHGASRQDTAGNFISGPGVCLMSKSSLVRCRDCEIVAQDCADLVAVENAGFVLVAEMANTQRARDLASGETHVLDRGHSCTLIPQWCGGRISVTNCGEDSKLLVVHDCRVNSG